MLPALINNSKTEEGKVLDFNMLLKAAQNVGLPVTIILAIVWSIIRFLNRSKWSFNIDHDPENKGRKNKNQFGGDNA
jgi:hypothetical protein